jgi:hypothetical protein
MATPRYAHCLVNAIRCAVERRLTLPAPKSREESAADFWSRVEEADLLVEALALYDAIAADWATSAEIPRETKTVFLQRLEREGRLAEAEHVLAELLAAGLSRREAQGELVERFQPLDGSATRAWATPDPWEAGRLFHKKADQDRLLARVADDEEDSEYQEAEDRVAWARYRRAEGNALAAARRRARDLTGTAPGATAVVP